MWSHYSLIIICLNIGSPRNYHFPFETNGKVVVLGVPILKQVRVHLLKKNHTQNFGLTGDLALCNMIFKLHYTEKGV